MTTEAELAVLKELVKNTASIMLDHETRIRRLERWVFMALGVIGVGGFLLHAFEKGVIR